MKCSHCNIREANTHYKRIINGVREEMYLCSECAEELGVMNDFTFEPYDMDSFFGGLLSSGAAAINSLAGIDRCGTCGSSLNDIINNGRVGCADCYTKFSDRLTPSIEKIHGRSKHIGKNVTYTDAVHEPDDAKKSPADDLAELKSELRQAVKEQRFEDAAVIRDKIKAISEEA